MHHVTAEVTVIFHEYCVFVVWTHTAQEGVVQLVITLYAHAYLAPPSAVHTQAAPNPIILEPPRSQRVK